MDHVTYKGRTIIDFTGTPSTHPSTMTLTVHNKIIAWHIWVDGMDKTEGKSLEDLQHLIATTQLLLETALQAPWAGEREATKEQETCNPPSP